jgi:sec-independent protein translocase protein TatC
LFLLGIAFGYFILSPMTIAFLANYTISDKIANEFDITSYVSTITALVLGSGLLFSIAGSDFLPHKSGNCNTKILAPLSQACGSNYFNYRRYNYAKPRPA